MLIENDDIQKKLSMIQYALLNIINHIGSIEFGHYYSFIKLFNKGMWYKFIDMRVNITGNKIINFDDAYKLFNKRS